MLAQPAWAQASKATAAQRRDLDRKAQLAFVSGRYQEAIDLFTQLYLDFGDAEYLRNLGRCHQRNRDPDKAIASFDEYLLKAKDLKPAEVAEIKGFIREMEDLKKKQAENAAAPGFAPVAPQAAPTPQALPTPQAAPPAAPAAQAPMAPAPSPVPAQDPGLQPAYPTYAPPAAPMADASASAVAPPPPAASSRSAGRTVSYVLMGLGAATLVGGGLVAAGSWSEYNKIKKDNGDCRVYSPACRDGADSVAKKNTTAKILFGVGGGLTAAGIVVFFVSPPPAATADGHSGLAFNLAGRF